MSNEIVKSENGNLANKPVSNKLAQLKSNFNTLSKALTEIEIPRLFHQLVIFVIDGSNSMHGKTINGISKAAEIDKSIKLIIERLKESKNHNSFDISFVAFSEDFNVDFGIKGLKFINSNDTFNPFDYVKQPKGTKLKEVLKHVEKISLEYLSSNIDKSSQVLIQILSDGSLDDYSDSLEIINSLKLNNKITIACQFIESEICENEEYYSWDESTGKIDHNAKWTIEQVKASRIRVSNKFKLFASNENLFVTSPNPEEIRNHMIKSISTTSRTSL